MGCLSLPKLSPTEPVLSAGEFERRCKTLAKQFSKLVGAADGSIIFAPVIYDAIAEMSFAGTRSEVIKRNRGSRHCVIQLCAITRDIYAWAGYLERWEKAAREQKFRFVSCGFTLHVGREGELAKPQILRSEWVGRRSGTFVEDAGHPHWQLDVLESARLGDEDPPVRFNDRDDSVVREFEEERINVAENLLFGLTVERMHLASAAFWWRGSPTDIAHVPASVADLDRWILGCAAYLRQEVRRCEIVPLMA
jgi:hypothetical protein